MTLGMTRNILGSAILALALTVTIHAQSTTQPPAGKTASATGTATTAPAPSTSLNPTGSEDNPYDPILEPPPLPKGKATLIGGIATSVDHVRNHITIRPFGGGAKVKVFVDERSHIYRNGVETTVLGIHKGDRVYADTMLDPSNDRILARNLRVVTDTGLAEVRGQVIATRPDRETITVRDQLSAKPVTFSVSGATSYSSTKGAADAGDVQPGSLIDVQFSPHRGEHDIARQIVVIAKPGDNYIFAGVVTNLDMRTGSLFVDNQSDDQSYEIHFTPADVADLRQLKIGSQVTARATFDGKQYKASNIRIESAAGQAGEESQAR